MSREREGLLRLYGAQVHVTESLGGMNEAVAAAQALARDDDVWLPDQFSNPANPEAHYRATGPEIWDGDGRAGRLPRRRRRHRRHDHRRRALPEGAQPGLPGRRRRARLLAGAVRRARPARTRSRASAPASSRRCWTARWSTRSSPSTTRTRSRPPACAARREGVLAGISCGAALCAALEVAAPRRRAASGSPSCCPTPASATCRRRSSPPSRDGRGAREPARARRRRGRALGAPAARHARPARGRERAAGRQPARRPRAPAAVGLPARRAWSATTRSRCRPST